MLARVAEEEAGNYVIESHRELSMIDSPIASALIEHVSHETNLATTAKEESQPISRDSTQSRATTEAH